MVKLQCLSVSTQYLVQLETFKKAEIYGNSKGFLLKFLLMLSISFGIFYWSFKDNIYFGYYDFTIALDIF